MRLPPLLRKLKTPPLSRRGPSTTPGMRMARDSSCNVYYSGNAAFCQFLFFVGARPPGGEAGRAPLRSFRPAGARRVSQDAPRAHGGLPVFGLDPSFLGRLERWRMFFELSLFAWSARFAGGFPAGLGARAYFLRHRFFSLHGKRVQPPPGFNPAAAEGIGVAGRGPPGRRSPRVTVRLPHRRIGTWRCRTFGLRSRSCGRR